jgi:hypothetical protein
MTGIKTLSYRKVSLVCKLSVKPRDSDFIGRLGSAGCREAVQLLKTVRAHHGGARGVKLGAQRRRRLVVVGRWLARRVDCCLPMITVMLVASMCNE